MRVTVEARSRLSNWRVTNVHTFYVPTFFDDCSTLFLLPGALDGNARLIFTLMPESTLPPPSISVRFGQPEHGWLPVDFQVSEFQLTFDASTVPSNPLDLLCEALAVVPAGGSTKVIWHLEPAVYWFAFDNEAGAVTLEISEASAYNKPSTCLLRLTGSAHAILLPFYRALTAFAGRKFSEAQWPVLTPSKLKPLGQLIRSQH